MKLRRVFTKITIILLLKCLDSSLFEVHLRVDVGEFSLESLDSCLGVMDVRLEKVRIILGAGGCRAGGVH